MSANSDIKLAIVIPAYRKAFLERAIRSVAQQTDRRFRLYVGDDASPDTLEPVVRSAAAGCELVFRRFEENLGGRSLVGHWDRCIRLSGEKWVWVFSDDDIMEAGCVEAFYRELERTGGAYDLYRFNTFQVDGDDRICAVSPSHPVVESSLEFAYHRLCGTRHSTFQELIFSRNAYDRVGVLPDFPHAWCADDAAIVLLGDRTGIRTIEGPRVHFRMSGGNITSRYADARVNRGKRKAAMSYLDWLMEHFRDAKDERLKLDSGMLRRAAERWFTSQCIWLQTYCTAGECREMAQFAARMWGGSARRHQFRFMRWNVGCLFNRAIKAPLSAVLRSPSGGDSAGNK
ncbi:MAG TPA: glycosyltransferase family A protein [Verrucomicrobiota bacterium]|nr:glycosyltransferase family A protein [Verrucomicrobiota bacterium]